MRVFDIIKTLIQSYNKNYSPYMLFMLALSIYFLIHELTNYNHIIESSNDNNLYFGFPEPANPSLYGIIELHNFIMFFIVMIVFFTLITISEVLSNFSLQHLRGVEAYNKAKQMYNISIYHNTRLELFWTAIPFMTLFAIAIPSFAFLYAGEIPRDCSLSLKVVAHQWYWSYELIVHLGDNMKPFYEPINTIDTNEFQAYVNTKFEGIISNGELGISNFESFMIFNNISSAELTAIYITFAEFEKLSISTKPVHNFPEIIECIRKFIFADQSLDLRPRFITQDTISSKNIMERSAIFTDMNNTLENKKENFFNLYTNNVEKDCSIAFDSYLQPIEDLKEGQRLLNTTNPVILPVGTYVKVLITSDDVIHSWALKDLGLKLDACPGRSNQTTLIIDKLGRYTGQCSELCGAQHGFMPIEIFCVDRITFISYFMNESEDFFHIFYKTNFLHYLWEFEKQLLFSTDIILPDGAIQLFNKEMLSKKSFEHIAKHSWGSFDNDKFSEENLSYIKSLGLTNEFKLIKNSIIENLK